MEHCKESKHLGSNFDDFLSEEGILEETIAAVLKRVAAWQVENGKMSTPPACAPCLISKHPSP